MEKHYFDLIVKSLSSGVLLQDKNLEILYCNDNASNILGLTQDQLLGKTSFDSYWACFHEDGTSYEAQNHPSARAIREGISIKKDIMGVRKPDNTMAWVSINAEPIFESNNPTPDYVVVSYEDISELKNKERQLEESNRELERFSYVASHDLQEPLRKINTFLSLFLSKNNEIIDEKSKSYLDKITSSTKRMENLINDLLAFSRTNNIKDDMEDVNCNDKISFIKESYNMLPTDRKVVIDAKPLPIIKGYKTQILSLFQNLVTNGLKYNKSEPAIITIDCEEHEKEYIFSVKDNGIGISQEDFDKIFLPFHRLHGKSEYAGSGIGLATCKKIVEKHNGKLWVESELGYGSTFYFSMPK